MSDGFFFLTILFFFFVAWVAGGGPSKPISFAGPFITPITSPAVIQSGYGDQVNLSAGATVNATRSNLFGIQRSITDLQKQVSDVKLFGDPSPYKGKVTIGWGSNVGSTDPKQEYITIKVAHDAPQNITITGWQVVSLSSDVSATIPKGTELLSSSGNTLAPIVLHPDDLVYLTTGESPVDVSFRENQCIGYYTHKQTFYPSLPQTCPDPRTEYDQYYTGNTFKDTGCYNMVQKLNRCSIPEESSGLSSSCYRFIDQHLSYSGCVATHRGDQYFWGSSWRVYLGRKELTKNHDSYRTYGELWKSSREGIKLLDENGKTVDLYQY